MKPIISVKEARKILGQKSEALNDEEVIKLINDLVFLARYAIKTFKNREPRGI
jgi:Ca2+-binding EF-hand superfamily protein